MDIKLKIDQDLKTALLAGKRQEVDVLKGLKTALQYAAVDQGNRKDLSEDEILAVFKRELKKRIESAELYKKAGSEERATKEEAEKEIIARYLPEELSDDELSKVIDEVMEKMGSVTPQQMGQVIGAVKQATKGAADGGRIASMVKERLAK